MAVNDLQLPTTFVRAVSEHIGWESRDGANPYGNRWPGVLHLNRSLKGMDIATATLQKWYPQKAQRFAHGTDFWSLDPGFIPYITDFSEVVQFGDEGGVSPVCFDFRDDPQQPSIIYWTGVYWRRVAPDFQAFLAQFQPLEWSNPNAKPLAWWTKDPAADGIILALSEASRYDIWDRRVPVLVHVVHSSAGVPIVIVLPIPEVSGGTVQVPPDWAITVKVTCSQTGEPSIKMTGTLKELEAGSPKGRLGQAVLTLVRRTIRIAGAVATPVIFRVAEVQHQNKRLSYLINETFVPDEEVVDADAAFFVSDDLEVRRFR